MNEADRQWVKDASEAESAYLVGRVVIVLANVMIVVAGYVLLQFASQRDVENSFKVPTLLGIAFGTALTYSLLLAVGYALKLAARRQRRDLQHKWDEEEEEDN